MAKLKKIDDVEEVVLGDDDKETETLYYEKLKGKTPKAALFVIDDEDYFIPMSQIHSADSEEKSIEVSSWWCEKEGLV